MVNIKQNKKLNKDWRHNILEMQKYRNDWKWARENKLIPNIALPNWMKQSSRLRLLISNEKFEDDGK